MFNSMFDELKEAKHLNEIKKLQNLIMKNSLKK